jgi:hypothetical protein
LFDELNNLKNLKNTEKIELNSNRYHDHIISNESFIEKSPNNDYDFPYISEKNHVDFNNFWSLFGFGLIALTPVWSTLAALTPVINSIRGGILLYAFSYF